MPGATRASADSAALALSKAFSGVEGAADKATDKIASYRASLVQAGVSEKAATVDTLKYAKSLANTASAVPSAPVEKFASTAQDAAGKAGNLAAALSAVGQQGSDMASQLVNGTSPLTVLVQQGPQLATQLSMAGFGLSSIAAAAAPLAIALGAVAATYAVVGNATYDAAQAQNEYAASTEAATDASNRIKAALAEVAAAQRETRDSTTDTGLKMAEMSGDLQDYELQAIQAGEAVRKGAAAEIQARQNANVAIRDRVDALRRAIAADETDSSLKPGMIAEEKRLNAEYQAGVVALRGLVDATNERSAILQQAIIDAGKEADAEEKSRKAREAHEKAMRAQEEALRVLSAAMQAENDLAERNAQAYQRGIDGLNSIESAQKRATASAYERVEADRLATEEAIAAQERAALAVTSTLAGEENVRVEAERARIEARAAYVAELEKLDAAHTAEVERQARERERIEQQSSNARFQLASTLAGSMVSLLGAAGEQMSDDQKRTLQALYAFQKAAALAQIAINTIQAVSAASASAPPPYNAIPMAVAAAQGATQFALAAAAPPPKFHSGTLSASGGSMRRGREFVSVVEEGEAIIPRATMQQPGAKEQAAALVSGRSPVASDEVADGMDKSSVPAILLAMLKRMERPAPRQRQSRPGHRLQVA